MAVFEKIAFVKLVDVTDSDGNERLDWRKEHVGNGVAVFFVTKMKNPGKNFIKFFTIDTTDFVYSELTTSIGGIQNETEEMFEFKTKNSIYKFLKNTDYSEEDKTKIRELFFKSREF